MQPRTLDHIAIWSNDRDALTDHLVAALDWRIVDRTNRYTLLGPSATAGKLTVFHRPDDQPVAPGRLVSILLAVGPGGQREPLEAPGGLTFTFAEHSAPRHAVVGLTLRATDPTACAARFVSDFGFESGAAHPGVASVAVGDGLITLVRESIEPSEHPTLFHLGLLVDSARDHIAEAEAGGIEVIDVVDAPNTLAVFVDGPGGICIEYVEHKPEFALAGR